MTTSEEIIYDSATRRHYALDELREAFRYRNLILQLARRDILTRYKRSVLGIAWTMLNPLGMMLVLTVAFSRMFQGVQGYSAYVLSGLIAWNFFSQSTTAAMVNLVWGGSMLHRIYMPRTSFALAAIGTALINQLVALIPLVLVMLVVGVDVKLTLLFFPVPYFLLACFSLGVGLLISTLAVYFPDVSEMYQIVLTAWFYLTPVIYPENILPQKFAFWITHLNPMYYMLKIFRMPIYQGVLPGWQDLLAATGLALMVLVIGWLIFCRKADDFAYRV